ncbi:unnamed protein product [Moneuplotes crassus]|uniref:Uncharacterized protein n=1 Tax=Euplotes crassus TaxID=5936 RepID=A0AAD1UMF7_EUPCR|nr:unnamed protein product [Moneuplotes crassus]
MGQRCCCPSRKKEMVEADRKHKECQVELSLVNETRPISQTKFNHEYNINNMY